MHTDPIADLLTRIRNGGRAGLTAIDAPMSKIKLEIAKILQSEGLIKGFDVLKDEKFPRLRVHLKYDDVKNKKPAITYIQRVSKPGLRIYKKSASLKPVLRGQGIAIVSTSHGLMVDKDARKGHIGGEVVCEVW